MVGVAFFLLLLYIFLLCPLCSFNFIVKNTQRERVNETKRDQYKKKENCKLCQTKWYMKIKYWRLRTKTKSAFHSRLSNVNGAKTKEKEDEKQSYL